MDLSDGELYEKYGDDLTRFATFLVGPSDASDVVVDAVLGAFGSRDWPIVREPRAYLYRAVLNRARMHARSERRRRSYEQRAARVEAEELTPADPDVLSAVARLSGRQRAVIYLTYWDDLSPKTIADLLGVSEGSVKRHLARGRETLRNHLDRSDDEH
jgi:RNA polymerase sigma factor (sigma-70 family)